MTKLGLADVGCANDVSHVLSLATTIAAALVLAGALLTTTACVRAFNDTPAEYDADLDQGEHVGLDQGKPPDLNTPPPVGDSGGSVPSTVGCSDGTREGFLDAVKAPKIAACGGAWSVPGIHNTSPACSRQAGNTGQNPAGTGCNISDLCAAGWHVCYGKADVLASNPGGCLNIMDGAQSPAFFLARTSSTSAFQCSKDSTPTGGPGVANDLFGCGDLGCNTHQGQCAVGTHECNPLVDCSGCPAGVKCSNGSSCTPELCFPLTRGSHDKCKGLRNDLSCGSWCNHLGKYPALKNTWSCGTDPGQEANNVVKGDPQEQGGVLCCKD